MSGDGYLRLLPVGALAPGEHTSLRAEGWDLLVANIDGDYFALEDMCTHAQAKLSEGLLEGCEMICAMHGARFDLRNGACTGPPATEDVKAFGVRVRDGHVEIRVDEDNRVWRPNFGPLN